MPKIKVTINRFETFLKLCTSQYSHESMPGAKFESGSFSSLGDMTSQNFPLKSGASHKIWIFTPENGFNFNFEIMSSYVQIRSFRPNVYPLPLPMSISANFKQRKIFFIF